VPGLGWPHGPPRAYPPADRPGPRHRQTNGHLGSRPVRAPYPGRKPLSLLRWLGLGGTSGEGAGPDPAAEDESDTVRRIAGRLERLDPATARYLATFAYVLARVAHVDLDIDAEETAEMERRVGTLASLSEGEAALVVEIAKTQSRTLGGADNYTVTREFRNASTPEQRRELLSCLFAVAAADGSISSAENSEISAIGDELGLSREELAAARATYRDKLAVLQGIRSG